MSHERLWSLQKKLDVASKNASASSLAEQAEFCRKLAVTVDKGVKGDQIDPLAGMQLVKEYLQGANQIVDNQNGINNYADMCLSEANKFSNHSKNWKSSIDFKSDLVQNLLKKHKPKSDATRINQTNHNKKLLDVLKTDVKSLELPKIPAEAISGTEKKLVPKSRNNISTNIEDSPDFDLIEPDLNEVSKLSRKITPPASKFNFSSSCSNPKSTSFSSKRKFIPRKKFQSPGSGSEFEAMGPGPGLSRASAPELPQGKTGPIFKTAHQQLIIDKQREGSRGAGISHSSYGSSKRNLGTRPGPAAGFKPPIVMQPGEGSYRNNIEPLEPPPSGVDDEDPRYKNIDKKMVELIKNEIMDQGEPVHWDDIAGLDFAKETVKEIVVWPMLRPDIFSGLRGPPKGLLLFGPPGTGKTLIGKCIASQSGSTFFSISASSLTSKWVGEGEKMVRALFAVAKVHQPAVVFIDEIDSLLSSRSDSEHESSRRIKTEFLVQLDGANTVGEERVLVVGATNRPQELDEAARRRLVKRLYIPLPEEQARQGMVSRLLARERHSLSAEDVVEIAGLTPGYSGADMANLCKEAAMGPIRSIDMSQLASLQEDQVRGITIEDFRAALRQVKASVSAKDLDLYLQWNGMYGAGK